MFPKQLPDSIIIDEQWGASRKASSQFLVYIHEMPVANASSVSKDLPDLKTESSVSITSKRHSEIGIHLEIITAWTWLGTKLVTQSQSYNDN